MGCVAPAGTSWASFSATLTVPEVTVGPSKQERPCLHCGMDAPAVHVFALAVRIGKAEVRDCVAIQLEVHVGSGRGTDPFYKNGAWTHSEPKARASDCYPVLVPVLVLTVIVLFEVPCLRVGGHGSYSGPELTPTHVSRAESGPSGNTSAQWILPCMLLLELEST